MVRNKLVSAMSQAIVVIASGQERDSNGRMSGTFDAGKSALQMGIPVFVLNPLLLNTTPVGNTDLINLGGKEFSNAEEVIHQIEQASVDSHWALKN
jgi:predicted Rossmann fold nucleotide-binding protein DprA/Smf involved in DNA uptake